MKEETFKGLLIGLPCYGGNITIETHSSICALRHVFGKLDVRCNEYALAMCDVVQTRNCMLTAWYDGMPEYDHLVMIDNDMQFEPRLVVDMLKLSKSVTGIVYAKHEIPRGKDKWTCVVGRPLEGEHPIVDGFQQWKYVGGGVLMIKRTAITQMLEQMPEIVDYGDPGALAQAHITRRIRAFDRIIMPDGVELSEDYSFCERWRRCGGEIWAGVEFTVGHVGHYTYTMNAAEYFGIKNKEPLPAEAVAA